MKTEDKVSKALSALCEALNDLSIAHGQLTDADPSRSRISAAIVEIRTAIRALSTEQP